MTYYIIKQNQKKKNDHDRFERGIAKEMKKIWTQMEYPIRK